MLILSNNLDDKDVWQYLLDQDIYSIQEFGIGIVGIGALFFAFGSVTSDSLKGLIALIGMGGSFILWMHMFGARKEFYEVKRALAKRNPEFIKRLDDARAWRKQGWYRLIYYPVTRLMTYFMGLVTIAWLIMLLNLLGVPQCTTEILTIVIVVPVFLNAVYQRYRDIAR